MRWGITDSMDAVEVCREEIKRCYESSYGPAFVACLSRRNGTKCLQKRIPLSEYMQIQKSLKKEERTLLDEFYEIDKNYMINPFYILKNEADLPYKVIVSFIKLSLINFCFKSEKNIQGKVTSSLSRYQKQ